MSDSSRPIALVTGASRGIGRAIALDLASTHHVIVGGRDQAVLDGLAASLPSASTWAADLEGDADLSGFTEGLDRLDVLVHSAGVTGGETVEATPRAEWRRVFDINVAAVAEITRLALPALRRAEGTIITINSGSGFTSHPGNGVYSASKFALRALTDSLREEERPHGVRVSAVHPGRVDTDMQHQVQEAMGGTYDASMYLEARDIAAAVRLVVDLPQGAVVELMSVRPLARPKP